jgi:hypothetical protein
MYSVHPLSQVSRRSDIVPAPMRPWRPCTGSTGRRHPPVSLSEARLGLRQSLQTVQQDHEVKPYAMRSPSRYARHTALFVPGGWMSTSGCSCRYRSSLGTWSGGPGGTSRAGQYRYQVSGARKGFPKSDATLAPSWWSARSHSASTMQSYSASSHCPGDRLTRAPARRCRR